MKKWSEQCLFVRRFDVFWNEAKVNSSHALTTLLIRLHAPTMTFSLCHFHLFINISARNLSHQINMVPCLVHLTITSLRVTTINIVFCHQFHLSCSLLIVNRLCIITKTKYRPIYEYLWTYSCKVSLEMLPQWHKNAMWH